MEVNKDILEVYWKNPKTHTKIHVGNIIFENDVYTFSYTEDVKKNSIEDFTPIIPFLDLEAIYTSKCLFPVFSSRLPDRKRPDIGRILKKYGMANYDEFSLLKCSGGRLPIDSLEFRSPINT